MVLALLLATGARRGRRSGLIPEVSRASDLEEVDNQPA